MDNEFNDRNGAGDGTANSYDYGFRMYEPRLGKFLSEDPLTADYPWYTPYQYAGNRPIDAIDMDGLEDVLILLYRTLDNPVINRVVFNRNFCTDATIGVAVPVTTIPNPFFATCVTVSIGATIVANPYHSEKTGLFGHVGYGIGTTPGVFASTEVGVVYGDAYNASADNRKDFITKSAAYGPVAISDAQGGGVRATMVGLGKGGNGVTISKDYFFEVWNPIKGTDQGYPDQWDDFKVEMFGSVTKEKAKKLVRDLFSSPFDAAMFPFPFDVHNDGKAADEVRKSKKKSEPNYDDMRTLGMEGPVP